ncbi:MAG: hypothetical protein F6K54_32455 [Okeania sp. SIO3B5]|uniref:hypothetical protein n=1 Tax=Okeania sp. SIO3B5 TaxID=2607811 RepID=UPI0014003959|nr:hypothetical protein [Okeania sp. SIO3B5]NEO57375.1 hypothetical protein [Okeania sp. SIO3B5]
MKNFKDRQEKGDLSFILNSLKKNTNLFSGIKKKKTKNQKTKALEKSEEKPESEPPQSQPDSSELSTDIVEKIQLPESEPPQSQPDSSELSTDIVEKIQLPESEPPQSQPDSSELSTDIVEKIQLPEEASPPAQSQPDSSELSTDIVEKIQLPEEASSPAQSQPDSSELSTDIVEKIQLPEEASSPAQSQPDSSELSTDVVEKIQLPEEVSPPVQSQPDSSELSTDVVEKIQLPEEASPPVQSQPDSSELSTDVVEKIQLPEEASPSGLLLYPESSELPTDIEQKDLDVVSPSELPDTSDVVYKNTKGLIYIQDLYSKGKASNLYTLDIESGKTVLIGSMGMHIVDIAFCGNILYGIRWRDQKTTDLVRINPTTAKTTIIGKLGNSKVASLAFSKHRKALYAMGPQTLFRVNVKTGAGRVIMSYKSYYPFYCGGLAFDSKGRAYSDFGNNNNRQRYLMRLNHHGTPIAVGGASGIKNSGSLDFYGDQLFAIFNGQFVKYDLVTGKARLVTRTEHNLPWAGMSVKLHPSMDKM